jgi:hypothetical protein
MASRARATQAEVAVVKMGNQPIAESGNPAEQSSAVQKVVDSVKQGVDMVSGLFKKKVQVVQTSTVGRAEHEDEVVPGCCACRHVDNERNKPREQNLGTSTNQYEAKPHWNDTVMSTPYDATYVAERMAVHVARLDAESGKSGKASKDKIVVEVATDQAEQFDSQSQTSQSPSGTNTVATSVTSITEMRAGLAEPAAPA